MISQFAYLPSSACILEALFVMFVLGMYMVNNAI